MVADSNSSQHVAHGKIKLDMSNRINSIDTSHFADPDSDGIKLVMQI